MHIPDNYLSPATCAVMGGAMVPVWTRAVRKVKAELSKVKIPMLGVGAAFSFLLMMFNIPLPGGTTGHAVGGTLLAILLGPYGACISITVALFLQALLFGDGGILSFGANCFNMAFVLPFAGYYIYRMIKNSIKSEKGEFIGMAFGSYVGINLAALCTAIEFGIQPLLFKDAAGQALYCPYPLSVSIPAMVLPHLLVAGIAEAVFTIAIILFIKRVSPGSFYEGKKEKNKSIYGLIIMLVCLTPLGILAAGTAWGEWGAEEISGLLSADGMTGFTPVGMQNGFSFNAVIPDYAVSGLPEPAGYVLSAIAGTAILIIFFKILGSLKKEKE